MLNKTSFLVGVILTLTVLTACSKDKEADEADSGQTKMEDQAEEVITVKAFDFNSVLAESIKNEALMHVENGDYNASERAFSEALAQTPNDRELQSLHTLSKIALLLEDFRKSRDIYPYRLQEIVDHQLAPFIPSDPLSGMPYIYMTDMHANGYCLSSEDFQKSRRIQFGKSCGPPGQNTEKIATDNYRLNSVKEEYSETTGPWGFGYRLEDGKAYYMINNLAYGPYDNIEEESLMVGTDTIAFSFQENGKWGVYMNGRTYAPFSASPPEIITFGEEWAFLYQDEYDRYSIKTSTRSYGPFAFADSLQAIGNNWGFRYCNYDIREYGKIMNRKNTGFKSQCGMVISHHKHGPYVHVEELHIGNSGWSAWITEQDGKYVVSPDHIWGPYPKNAIAQIHSPDNFVVQYEQEAGKYIVVVNGDSSGPYTLPVGDVIFSQGNYAFQGEKEEYSYINYNGRLLGPYAKSGIPDLHGSEIGYWYQSTGGAYFVIINEKTYGPYSLSSGVVLAEGLRLFQYMKDDQYFVVVNEKKYGPYQNMKEVAIDKGNWGVEVLLENDPHLLVNGSIYGPFPNAYSFSLLPELQKSRTALIFSDRRWLFLSQEFINDPNQRSRAKKYTLIVDGKKQGPFFHGGSEAYVNPVKWLITDEHWSFWYEDRLQKQHLVIDGQDFGPHKQTYHGGPVFAGENWGYRYKDFQEDYYTIVNGQQFGPYEDSSPPRFANAEQQ